MNERANMKKEAKTIADEAVQQAGLGGSRITPPDLQTLKDHLPSQQEIPPVSLMGLSAGRPASAASSRHR
jgi:hypothetical protein